MPCYMIESMTTCMTHGELLTNPPVSTGNSEGITRLIDAHISIDDIPIQTVRPLILDHDACRINRLRPETMSLHVIIRTCIYQ